METPDSTPSADVDVEGVPYITGQVVPGAPGSDQFESDAPGADDAEEDSGRVWPFLFEWRWIVWHLSVVAAFLGMLWLGDWQYHRAIGGNGLSWAYTFEWPLFAGFAVVFWARTVKDEFALRRGAVSETELVARAALARSMAMLPKGAMLPAGALPDGVDVRQLEQPGDEEDDPELASYNAYLAKLNAEVKGHNKWLRAIHS
ncbi:MAG TPA: hypothetical protein VGG83_30640 [Trebonia sp.]|jgi:hypothetical protein